MVVLGEDLRVFVVPELALEVDAEREALAGLPRRQLRAVAQVVHAIVDDLAADVVR